MKEREHVNDLKDPPKEHKVRGISGISPDSEALIKRIAGLVAATRGEDGSLPMDLQIRDGYIDVYYEGGCLWKVSNLRSGRPHFHFDPKYSVGTEGGVGGLNLPKPDESGMWLNSMKKLQKIMSQWFVRHEKEERRVQQALCARHLQDKNSEWIILDIEYAAWLHGTKSKKDGGGRRLCRFDFIAFRRRVPGIVYLVELKLTKGASHGSSGILNHAEDFAQFLGDKREEKALNAFKASMRNILREKSDLGLIPSVNVQEILSDGNWPKTIRPMFSLDTGAAKTLSTNGERSDIRAKSEEILSGLFSEEASLWTDLSFRPLKTL